MAVFRVERNTGYTVMSNHHLRNKELSLKQKGCYHKCCPCRRIGTIPCRTVLYQPGKYRAIRTAVWELEKAGYNHKTAGTRTRKVK